MKKSSLWVVAAVLIVAVVIIGFRVGTPKADKAGGGKLVVYSRTLRA